MPIQIQYGQNSTPANLASELASLLDCLDGQVVNSVAEGATVIMTSCAAGTNTNYAISAYADGYGPTSIFPQNSFGISASGATMSVPAPTYSTGSFIFDGAEQSAMVNGSTVYDNGIFFIFTQGPSNPPLDVPYEQGSTPSSIALYVAQHIRPCSVSGEEFSAVANGPVVTLTSCQPGSNSNYPLDGYLTYYNPTFAKPSFSITDSGATMTGGNSFNRVYDSGTVSLTINGTQIASTTYGSASTPASIASGLVTSGASNGLVTLQANGANLTMTANGDGTQTNYTYAINVVSNSSIFASEPSFSSSTPSGTLAGGQAAPLYNWSISSYAPDGDVLAMTDSVMGAWTYTYDAMNRLTSGTASAGVDAGLTLGWTYDRYGNRWAQNATGSGSATATQGQLSFTGNNNRIDGWLYDAAGNLLYDNINHYTYDAENRIATLNGQSAYIYDAEGRRVAKLGAGGAVTASYILGLGGEQLSEINAAGQWAHSNVFAGGGRLLATYEGPGGAAKAGYHFHLTDWLGTNRMQTTLSGNQEETCVSYPFGDGLTCTGSADATEQHFTGKERDAESGLDYFFARYLSSNLGRFMTPDWAGAPTAVPYATFGNPQSLNLYAYVGNNPNSGIDFNGHVTENRGGIPDVPGNYCADGMDCSNFNGINNSDSNSNSTGNST
ncbi:MAG TPA: RHS repeat-associated core domain-containing protein, partial [Terracidiphilus sp.]